MKENESLFICPICRGYMTVSEFTSLNCSEGHTFDLAKQGYVNFLNQRVQTKYGKKFFEARREFFVHSDFYAPLQRAISEIAIESIVNKKQPITILDTGCGEGTYLQSVTKDMRITTDATVVGVGVDISKEGIIFAARSYDKHIWTVADLSQMPFQEKQFELILNIFSPSNYKEFHRLLSEDGAVIKVVPEENYLRELRTILFASREKQRYSNQEIVTRFKDNFQTVKEQRVTYTKTINEPLLHTFLEMTPLAWSSDKEKRLRFLEMKKISMTVDARILVGKKHASPDE